MLDNEDAEGTRLPIKLDTTSNGEYLPLALRKEHRLANELALQSATRNAKQTGVGRRQFLVSASGAAATLLAFNSAYAAAGRTG